MNSSQNVYTVIGYLLLGGMLGIIGQGIRIVVGLKKSNDEAQKSSKAFKEVFEPSKLIISIIISFIVGAVAGMIGVINMVGQEITKETMFTIVGFGYAGTDFIEGFINKYLPV